MGVAYARCRSASDNESSRRSVPWLVVFLTFWVATTLAAPIDQQALERGIQAFRRGDYRTAIEAFERAHRTGMRTPALSYNLGVTYYRLQRYPDAQREFTDLLGNAEWAPLAHYNLGLTAQRLRQFSLAAKHYQHAHENSTESKLRTLAAIALERLGYTPPPARTSVLVSTAAGYDGNVTLAPESEVVDIAENNDYFAELTGAVSHRVGGTPASGLYLHGGMNWRDYYKVEGFDQFGWNAGFSHARDMRDWQTSVGAYVDVAYVDGERLAHIGTFDLQARRRLDAARDWHLGYQPSRVDGVGEFDYLDGWQHRFLADAGLPWADGRLRGGYQLELNDRRDLMRDGEFLSYSPTRHTLFVTMAWPAAQGWGFNARGEFRHSRYNDPNRIDGGTLEVTRKEDRYLVSLRADRRFGEAWRLFVDYSYISNDSNLETYEYHRYQLLAGVEWAR